MTRLFWICLGGALGTGARYLVSGMLTLLGTSFPYGTLARSTCSARSCSARS